MNDVSKKQIEPTDAMVDKAVALEYDPAPTMIRAILRAALNHPDAAKLFADEDDRPWEPLAKGNPVRVGDEVRHDLHGTTRTGIVARVEKNGEVWTAEGGYIGVLDLGTWHFRRPAPELPTEDGAVIVPADGHEFITMTDDEDWSFDRMTYSAKHDRWYGMTKRGAIAMCLSEQVTPGTWKVDER